MFTISAVRPTAPAPAPDERGGRHINSPRKIARHQRRAMPLQRALNLDRIAAIIQGIGSREVCLRVSIALLARDGWANVRDVIGALRKAAAWCGCANISRDVRIMVDRLTDQRIVEQRGDSVRLVIDRPKTASARLPSLDKQTTVLSHRHRRTVR